MAQHQTPDKRAAQLADRATSSLLIGADWNVIMQLCDFLTGQPRAIPAAVAVIKDRIIDKDSDVNMRALELCEALVKNVPRAIPVIGVKDFLNTLHKKSLQHKLNIAVREKLLELIGGWGVAFQDRPDLAFATVYQKMRKEGISFPQIAQDETLKAAAAAASPRKRENPRDHPSYPKDDAGNSGGEQKKGKLSLEVVQNNITLLREMLRLVDPSKEDVQENDIVNELLGALLIAQQTIQKAISGGSYREETIMVLLTMNDEIIQLQTIHTNLTKGVQLSNTTSPSPSPSVSRPQHTEQRPPAPDTTSPLVPALMSITLSPSQSRPPQKQPPPQQQRPAEEPDEFEKLARSRVSSGTKATLPTPQIGAQPQFLPSFVPDFGTPPQHQQPVVSHGLFPIPLGPYPAVQTPPMGQPYPYPVSPYPMQPPAYYGGAQPMPQPYPLFNQGMPQGPATWNPFEAAMQQQQPQPQQHQQPPPQQQPLQQQPLQQQPLQQISALSPQPMHNSTPSSSTPAHGAPSTTTTPPADPFDPFAIFAIQAQPKRT